MQLMGNAACTTGDRAAVSRAQRGKEAQTHFCGQQQQCTCPHGLGRMCCLPWNDSEVVAQKNPQKKPKKGGVCLASLRQSVAMHNSSVN